MTPALKRAIARRLIECDIAICKWEGDLARLGIELKNPAEDMFDIALDVLGFPKDDMPAADELDEAWVEGKHFCRDYLWHLFCRILKQDEPDVDGLLDELLAEHQAWEDCVMQYIKTIIAHRRASQS